ncbi:MAG: hypothetical protein FWD48_11215 [Oscillospiraceae bacterium]|nr:hypothetical protein [Oscillospiraceae bacterium]
MKRLTALFLAGMILLAACNAEEPLAGDGVLDAPPEAEEPDVGDAVLSVPQEEIADESEEPELFFYRESMALNYNDYTIVIAREETEEQNRYIILEKNGAEVDRVNAGKTQSSFSQGYYMNGDLVLPLFGIEPIIIAFTNHTEAYYNPDTFFVYTIGDDKFLPIEFYEDGEKIEEIGVPILTGIPIGDNSFKVFYSNYAHRDFYGEVVFTYDSENNRFNGVSQRLDPDEGSLKIAFDSLEKLNEYQWKVYYTTIETVPNETWNGAGFTDPYSKITEEGFRTEDEYIETLNEIFTEELSHKIYAQLFVEFEQFHGDWSWTRPPHLIEKEDGLYHIKKDGFGGSFIYGYYIDIISENTEIIEANVYTLYWYGGSGPYHVSPNFATMTIEKNIDGEWRISQSSVADNI